LLLLFHKRKFDEVNFKIAILMKWSKLLFSKMKFGIRSLGKVVTFKTNSKKSKKENSFRLCVGSSLLSNIKCNLIFFWNFYIENSVKKTTNKILSSILTFAIHFWFDSNNSRYLLVVLLIWTQSGWRVIFLRSPLE
jgi:hypothetical protein